MTTFLITGASGQVGRELCKLAVSAAIPVKALTHRELDITDECRVLETVSTYQPTHIINLAAYNAVDRAEEDIEDAFRANALGPMLLAFAARRVNAVLIHYSTDYVFDGEKNEPYTEEDLPNPLSAYGRSKLEGERLVQAMLPNHYILRTSAVFAQDGKNFVTRLLSRLASEDELSFVDDVFVSPTYAGDLARVTLALIERSAPFGLYHATGSQPVTPFQWAQAVVKHTGRDRTLESVSSDSFSMKARRPKRPILSNAKLASLKIAVPSGIDRLNDFFIRGEKQ